MKLSLIRLPLLEGVEVRAGDPEDWEVAEAVELAFRESGIRVDHSKEIGQVALLDGEVIGGTMFGWHRDADLDCAVYSFDVAVRPAHRGVGRGHSGLGGNGVMNSAGIQLVRAAVDQYEAEKGDVGGNAMMSLYVVNPKLARFLENRMGFEVESEYGHGATQLVRY